MGIKEKLKLIEDLTHDVELDLRTYYPLVRLIGKSGHVSGRQICLTEEGDYLTFEELQELWIEAGRLFNLELRAKTSKSKKGKHR